MPNLQYEYDFITGMKNPIGTHIKIETDAHQGTASCEWTVKENYIGYDHILHGGIAASIIDNLMIYAGRAWSGQDVVTANINVNYRTIVYVGDHLLGEARVVSQKEGSRAIHLHAELKREDTIVSEADGVVVIVFPDKNGNIERHRE